MLQSANVELLVPAEMAPLRPGFHTAAAHTPSFWGGEVSGVALATRCLFRGSQVLNLQALHKGDHCHFSTLRKGKLRLRET